MNSQESKYIIRDFENVTLNEFNSGQFNDIRNVVILLNDENDNLDVKLDLGSLMFFDSKHEVLIDADNRMNREYILSVDKNSFMKHLVDFVTIFGEYLQIRRKTNRSKKALFGQVRRVIVFLKELNDHSQFGSFLKSKKETIEIYSKVTIEIKYKINIGLITPRRADLLQNDFALMIEIRYGKQFRDYVVENNLSFHGRVNTTVPREIVEIRDAFETYKSLALQLTDYLVNEKSLPFLIKMPNYETFLFPYANHRVTPYCNRPTDAYNHEEGRLSTLEEMLEIRKGVKESIVKSDWKRICKRFDVINADPRSKCRRAFAATALQSYQMMFMMLTGSYASEISQLEFDDSMEFSKSAVSKSYRAIKLRAAGRPVQYDLSHAGVNLFKSYLRLRQWVLNGNDEKYLFFGLKVKEWSVCSVNESNIRSFQRKKIIGIFMPSDYKMITSRELRKTKSIFLHEQPDVGTETVATVLNHSTRTNQKHYMEVSVEKQKSEMESFWSAAQEAVNHIKTRTGDSDQKVAAGHCEAYTSPESAIDSPPIKPDCKSQYGCLFCIHYVCHANDDEDVHKLASLLYIVSGVIQGSKSGDKALELFQMLSSRVRKILYHIKMKSSAGKLNVNRQLEKVFKYEELTPYWESRLQRYEELGIIFTEPQMEPLENV